MNGDGVATDATLPDRIVFVHSPSKMAVRGLASAVLCLAAGLMALVNGVAAASLGLVAALVLILLVAWKFFFARRDGEPLVLDRVGFGGGNRLIAKPFKWTRISTFARKMTLDGPALMFEYRSIDAESVETNKAGRKITVHNFYQVETKELVKLLNAFRDRSVREGEFVAEEPVLPDRLTLHAERMTVIAPAIGLLACGGLIQLVPVESWGVRLAILAAGLFGGLAFPFGVFGHPFRLELDTVGLREVAFGVRLKVQNWLDCSVFAVTGERDQHIGFSCLTAEQRRDLIENDGVRPDEIAGLQLDHLRDSYGMDPYDLAHLINRFRERAVGKG